jgi:hypothetical protein
MQRAIRFALLLLLLTSTTVAQHETWKWYFGFKAGLDFSTNPPTALTGSMSTNEGCSSISDANGNLLFYTDGSTVWNGAHQVMGNGTGLMGHTSGWQSALIVKKPGGSNLYYLFTAWPPNGFYYSIVDMNLAAGMGSVTATKNILLNLNTTEGLTAVRHCNGTDIWVTICENGSSTFKCYLLTTSGISSTVTSVVGTAVVGSGACGIKFSPNGRRLARIFYGQNQEEVSLFDFNPISGIISNQLILSISTFGYYGAEFSPDCTKLFAATLSTPAKITQWDLCAGSPSAIVNSSFAVNTPTNQTFGMLQLAENGKIYTPVAVTNSVAVINNPNLYGAACGFTLNGPSIGANMGWLGLPGFVTSLLPHSAPAFASTVSCLSTSFTAGCTAVNYSVLGMQWNFGEPSSGAANSSTLSSPSHQYSVAGTYTVKLKYTTPCGADSVQQAINVGLPPQVTISTTTVCAGSSATINASQPVNWYNSATSGTPVGTGTVLLTPTLSAGNYTYYLSPTDCTISSAWMPVTVSVYPIPVVTVVPTQTSICAGSATSFSASGSVNWYTAPTSTAPGSTGPVFVTPTLSAGGYTYFLSPVICSLNSTWLPVTVSVNPLPVVTVAPSQSSVCAGTPVILTATGAVGYQWNNGALTQTTSVSSSITTMYTVTGTDANGCSSVGGSTVTILKCLSIADYPDGDSGLSVYPQPALQALTIVSDVESNVTIVNLTGSTVLKSGLRKGTNSLDLTALAPGVYLLVTERRAPIKIVVE